jgi:ribose transport system ATP-binding protein
LELSRGEIVGIAGIVGSGYDQLLGLIFGGRHRASGNVEIDGGDLPSFSPRKAIQAGVAFAPADRNRLGAMRDWTVRENITLPLLQTSPRGWLGNRAERAEVQPWIDRLDIRPPDPERLFALLSGGNQQKAVLARWLRSGARVILLNEPTNGVDVGAKHAIYEIMQEACKSGTAFLISSSDSEELCAVCDRVIVIRDGRVGAVLAGAALNVDALLSECLRESSPNEGVLV